MSDEESVVEEREAQASPDVEAVEDDETGDEELEEETEEESEERESERIEEREDEMTGGKRIPVRRKKKAVGKTVRKPKAKSKPRRSGR